jgi:hypothetical protein
VHGEVWREGDRTTDHHRPAEIVLLLRLPTAGRQFGTAGSSLPCRILRVHLHQAACHNRKSQTTLILADGDQTFVSGRLSLFALFEREHPVCSHLACLLHAQVEKICFLPG